MALGGISEDMVGVVVVEGAQKGEETPGPGMYGMLLAQRRSETFPNGSSGLMRSAKVTRHQSRAIDATCLAVGEARISPLVSLWRTRARVPISPPTNRFP